MSRLDKIIKLEVEQVTMRRNPTMIQDRLDEVQAFAAVLIEAAQTSDMSMEYVDDVTAQFMFALDAVVRFGQTAAHMVKEERELRRDAVADRDSLIRQVSGLQALVEHLQINRVGEIEKAIQEAVAKLAAAYDADPDELMAALQKQGEVSRE